MQILPKYDGNSYIRLSVMRERIDTSSLYPVLSYISKMGDMPIKSDWDPTQDAQIRSPTPGDIAVNETLNDIDRRHGNRIRTPNEILNLGEAIHPNPDNENASHSKVYRIIDYPSSLQDPEIYFLELGPYVEFPDDNFGSFNFETVSIELKNEMRGVLNKVVIEFLARDGIGSKGLLRIISLDELEQVVVVDGERSVYARDLDKAIKKARAAIDTATDMITAYEDKPSFIFDGQPIFEISELEQILVADVEFNEAYLSNQGVRDYLLAPDI